jgi:endoglucanase
MFFPFRLQLALLAILTTASVEGQAPQQPVAHIRINQAGYRPAGVKSAIAFSSVPLEGTFHLTDADTEKTVFEGKLNPSIAQTWGSFRYHAELDFSAHTKTGRYQLRLMRLGVASSQFTIGTAEYAALPDQLLEFMRQQRCGYNPFLDSVCHPFDGRTAYGAVPDGTYLDARGGWHDAGDQLKYLLTASNATAQMLLAYRVAPVIFGDKNNEWGQPIADGIPDVLNEARWGLDWMLKLHPAPDQLIHQVADDRDHIGWRLPQKDSSDYGWGPGSYRVAYFATGKPQGLGRFQSESTGIANLAGRYAAAMALAHQIWKADARMKPYADHCLRAGVEVYRLGKAREGFQQGNSYGSPYRYNETTWADDMEWGAAELYRATGERSYLEDAKRYAQVIGNTSWMGRDTVAHYQFYPFMNLGHFALNNLVDKAFQKTLAGYYREGLESCRRKGSENPYRIGIPFIWCSNNLVVALATQGYLYEAMTRDASYHAFTSAQVDWLFGCNPWGTSMFTGLPDKGIFPRDPHLVTTNLTGRPIRGGLVDGPVAEAIFKSLKGVALSRPDPFAEFQCEQAVYHDDMADYASNEPTMDGTASAILLLALVAAGR